MTLATAFTEADWEGLVLDRLGDHGRRPVAVWDNHLKIQQPPPAAMLSQRLQELCDFANGSRVEDRYLFPVVRSVIVHFMVGFDHYFVDGNGRTAPTGCLSPCPQ